MKSPVCAGIYIIAALLRCAAADPAIAPVKKDITFSAGTEEVSLDMVVRDKHDRPLRDLKPEDIQITDDSERVFIHSVRLATLSQPRLLILLFDASNTTGERLAREGARELSKAAGPEEALLAVAGVGSRLGIIQSFTNDRDELKKAIDIATNPGPGRSDAIRRTEEQLRHTAPSAADGAWPAAVLLDAVTASQRVQRDQRLRPALASLLGLVRGMAKRPGRKAIVYFSEGLQLSTAESGQFQNLISEANRAGVSIYAVDASANGSESQVRAMQSAMTAGGAKATPSVKPPDARPTGMQGFSTQPRGQFGSVTDCMTVPVRSALSELASSTGGVFVSASDDFRKPMRRLLEDEEVYYQVTYTPHIQQYDGHFRKVAVSVNRPGVTVQTRAGYFTLPPSAMPLSAFELPMLKAINELHANGAVDPEIHVRAFEFRSSIDSISGAIVVELPLSHLQPQDVAGEQVFRLHFSILTLIVDASGKTIAKFSQDVPWRAALETKDRALAGVFTFQRSFAAPAGRYRIETAVYDLASEKIGVASGKFEFTERKAPTLSEAMLVRKLDPLPAAPDPDDLLQYGNKSVVPRLTAAIRREPGGKLPVFFVVYPDAASSDKPSLALQIVGEGVSAKEVPMSLSEKADRNAIPFLASIPTENLSPGDYALRVIFRQGAAKVTREVSFAVEGDAGALPAKTGGAGALPAIEDKAPDEPGSKSSSLRLLDFRPSSDGAERPSPADQTRIIAGARRRALVYAASLPDFTCVERTRRLVAKAGSREWRPQDTMSELVRYVGGMEERRMLELNGERSTADRSSLKGTLSNGEFGNFLQIVLGEKVQSKFDWKETVFLGGERCEVFSYRVERAHSQYRIGTAGAGHGINTAFSGAVYVDANTFNIRRVTVEAVDIPRDFPVQASSLSFDYDYVRVGQTDYLLPVAGMVQVHQGRRSWVRNEIQFRDYRRFGSETNIKFDDK